MNCLNKCGLQETLAAVRITLTRGSGPRGLSIPSTAQPLLLIQCVEIPKKKTSAICVTYSDIVISESSPLRQFKSLSYTENILAREQAVEAGYDDALIFNSKGHLVSASCANIFLIVNDVLMTPDIDSGALPGIMRRHVLESAAEKGISVAECKLTRENCDKADQAFLTNSLVQIQPIKKLGGRELSPTKLKYRFFL